MFASHSIIILTFHAPHGGHVSSLCDIYARLVVSLRPRYCCRERKCLFFVFSQNSFLFVVDEDLKMTPVDIFGVRPPQESHNCFVCIISVSGSSRQNVP